LFFFGGKGRRTPFGLRFLVPLACHEKTDLFDLIAISSLFQG
jgi:hypothetical protein